LGYQFTSEQTMHNGIPATVMTSLISLTIAFSAFAQQPPGQLKTEVVSVEVRPGVTMKYLGVVAEGRPNAAVILLAGGKGALKLGPSGAINSDLGLNFLIRSRQHFAREGLYVAALDAASDFQDGMNGVVRLSQQHATDIGRVIADVKGRVSLPVWVVGTSAGTLSTANVAARLSRSELRPHGIVLTSAMTQLDAAGHCGKSLYDVQLSAINLPVLIVSHRDDGCPCSPGGPAAGGKLIAALAGTSTKEHQILTGGSAPVSGPCDARAQHGFFGIEISAIKTIADWVRSR
jgi:hypothetical protein